MPMTIVLSARTDSPPSACDLRLQQQGRALIAARLVYRNRCPVSALRRSASAVGVRTAFTRRTLHDRRRGWDSPFRRWFESHHYGVSPQTGRLDYDAIEEQARKVRPALLIAGASAYPRVIDFQSMAHIAQRVGARLLADIAHIAGLVAAGVHPSPVPHADIVTCTTTKTLRGPRGGLILSRSDEFAKALQSAVFPGVQGSLHPNVLAAKAVSLGEALRPEFKSYGAKVVENARHLCDILEYRGLGLAAGGTDTHLVVIDLSSAGVTGQQAEDALARAGITSNKNPIPFDPPRPSEWSGLRLGVSAVTTRGFGSPDMETLGHCIADLILAKPGAAQDEAVRRAKQKVAVLTGRMVWGLHS